MKILTKTISALVLIGLLALTLLFNSCGRKEAESQGCPADSFLANQTDTIAGPANATFEGGSSFGNPFPGGSVLYSPAVFTVTDSSGLARNKVCLKFYTDGFWYSDNTYSTTINGSGPFNSITVVTNDQGSAFMYWSTEILPSANLASVIPPSTTLTAGADIKGQSFITVYSGVLSNEYDVNWTVKGEPAQ